MTDRIARTAWLDGPGELRFAEEPLPAPGPGEIACETLITAISPGTEIAAWTGMPPLRRGPTYPRLQGYCNVARVVECGDGVEGIARGDRVLTHQSHRSHFNTRAGDALYRLPEGVDAGAIASTYLFHLGYHAILESGVRPGHRVLVQGLGVLGLTAVRMAAIAGAQVTAVSDHAEPAAIARAYGAREVVGRTALDQRGETFDMVVSTVNGWADWQRALRSCARRGTIACLGFPGRGENAPAENPLTSEHFYAKQLTLKAVGLAPADNDARGHLRFNQRDNIAYLASAIADGIIDTAPIISGTYPAARLADAYAALVSRESSPVTFLLDWQA